MYRERLALIVFVFVTSCAVRRPAPAGAGDERAVLRLDSLWANSYATHDTAFMGALLDKDILIVSSSGALKTREAELSDALPAPGMSVDYFRSADRVIRIAGDGAVVTGILEWALTSGTRTSRIRRRYSATYSRGGSLGWRMIALHIGAALSPAG